MAQRYIEIFEERNENGKSKLSYFGFDKKMHDVCEADIESIKKSIEELWAVMPNDPNTGGDETTIPVPDWIDGEAMSRVYTITNTLTNVTTDNAIKRVTENSGYSATLTLANSAKSFATCTVTMGGTSITSSAVSSVTGAAHKKKITIPEVTGDVVITATQSS